MLYDFNPTVRKYPRSMLEAFPSSIESAQWMEHYKAPATAKDVALYLVLLATTLALVTATLWML